MGFWENIALAFAGLKSNKMRSFLTMLGIIIGVASVIILVSLMQGMTGEVVIGKSSPRRWDISG